MRFLVRRIGAAVLAAALPLSLAACGDNAGATGGNLDQAKNVRLGFFPNLTHATALVGVQDGIFKKALGDGVELTTSQFNAGPAAVEAIFSGALDATFIGPSPTINAYAKSNGEAVRVVAGAASGGAALVVKPEITSAADLKGKKIATPQLGNTQDVALRFWLDQQGLKTTTEGGGDVSIVPQDNAQTLDTFSTGVIDGAWVPEPYVTRLFDEGGKVLLDEKSLWPNGQFVTTHLIVRTQFLRENPGLVRKLVQGVVDANASINADPAKAQKTVSDYIGQLTGKPLPADVVAQAWKNLTFTDDPLPATLVTGAEHAKAVGLLDEVKLDGLYDLGPLNEVLRSKGQPEVKAP